MSDLIPDHLRWFKLGHSPRTVAARERLLYHAEAHLPRGLDDTNADGWADYLGTEGWSAWTRYTYRNHAHGFYEWGIAIGEYEYNPIAQLPRLPEGDRVPNPVTDDELAHALTHLPEQPWRMAVRLAAFAGLRCCELVAVERKHCTREWLRVKGKGDRVALVPMAPALWAVVEPMPPGLLVRSARGLPLTAAGISARQGAVWARIGLPDVTMHRFRHWCGTDVQRRTGNIRVTQKMLRHASVRSTEGYTMVSDAELHAAVATLGGRHEPVSSRLVPAAA